jgi:hypothetical protein
VLEQAFQIAFAAGIVLAAAALAAGVLDYLGRIILAAAAGLLAAAALSAWIAFALEPGNVLAVTAAGLTACLLVALAAIPLQRAVSRSRRFERELEDVEERVREVVDRMTTDAAVEIEHVATRARAESVSLLAEEERRIGEERRREVVERERAAHAELTDTLAAIQRRVENRLAGWAEDLDRTQQNLVLQLDRLAERQKQLIVEAEARVAHDVEHLEAGSVEQRAALVRLREELAAAAEQIVSESAAELEQHAAERRRALRELAERLRRREREITERIEREEAEATQRIHSGFADIERRALEQLERASDRAWASYSEQAAQQFADLIRSARDDAARRLSRELDRAVESFTREAQNVLAERLAHVGDAGARRLEKRMDTLAAGIERQREELFAGLEQRLGDAEATLRRRLQSIVADAEAERAVLEARLHDLVRRVDEAASGSHDRVSAVDRRGVG